LATARFIVIYPFKELGHGVMIQSIRTVEDDALLASRLEYQRYYPSTT
jgi:hypothetical protein